MAKSFTDEDDALLAELGVEVEVKKQLSRTPREERIIAGFEEILRFADEHGLPPQHGEDRDIFERLYAVRLDRIRDLQECRDLLAPLDEQDLLANTPAPSASDSDDLDDDALLAELGVEVAKSPLTELKHVRSTAEKKAADEVARQGFRRAERLHAEEQPRSCRHHHRPGYGERRVRLDLVRTRPDGGLSRQPDGDRADHRPRHPRCRGQDPSAVHQPYRGARRRGRSRDRGSQRYTEGDRCKPADGAGAGPTFQLHAQDREKWPCRRVRLRRGRL
ncbi:hypothetical protein RV420_50001 [Roseovarius sp. EC-SD190]|nr:hypothetical protein RV420_50001 [Roseovarius sp. EC-SD190]